MVNFKFSLPSSPRWMRRPADDAKMVERSQQAEIARNLWVNYKILPPSSPRRSLWDFWMLFLVLYNCIYVPVEWAFDVNDPEGDGPTDLDVRLLPDPPGTPSRHTRLAPSHAIHLKRLHIPPLPLPIIPGRLSTTASTPSSSSTSSSASEPPSTRRRTS